MSYVRVSILGTIAGGEKWSINPVFDPTGELETGFSQAALDSAANAIALLALPLALQQLLGSINYVAGARLEIRADADDSLIGLSEKLFTPGTPGSTTVYIPAQSAVVVSLRTNTPGASGRGRLYWPAIGAQLGGTLRLSTPTPTATVDAFKTYLTAMRDALAAAFPTIGFNLAVRSKLTHTTPHVTQLRVGNVIDTQRRRRDSLPEAYSTATLP